MTTGIQTPFVTDEIITRAHNINPYYSEIALEFRRRTEILKATEKLLLEMRADYEESYNDLERSGVVEACEDLVDIYNPYLLVPNDQNLPTLIPQVVHQEGMQEDPIVIDRIVCLRCQSTDPKYCEVDCPNYVCRRCGQLSPGHTLNECTRD